MTVDTDIMVNEKDLGKNLYRKKTYYTLVVEQDVLAKDKDEADQKFLDFMKTSATKTLKEGIKESWNTIKNDKSNYNPLKYLDQAKENKVDLKKFFPK